MFIRYMQYIHSHLILNNILMTTKSPTKINRRQKRLQDILTVFVIGDEGVNKSYLFNYLSIEEEELNQELNIYVKDNTNSVNNLQVYDFPTDKIIRSTLQLYFHILQPNIILYLLNIESTANDVREWIIILHEYYPQARLLFISDVSTYMERESLVVRLSNQFDSHVLDIICFVALEHNSLERALANIGQAGVPIYEGTCLKPSLTKRMWESLQRFYAKCKLKIMPKEQLSGV